ncbi:pectate lyase-like adhesive domain-containing protein [Holzapfeliella sp. He02]|uniref:Pectate lyase-like adhesive domain-containing protein n=1 Tax=Holzapfeliella saturejae TaxID=3082953 RepID=A0ABU8SGG8_9LACO
MKKFGAILLPVLVLFFILISRRSGLVNADYLNSLSSMSSENNIVANSSNNIPQSIEEKPISYNQSYVPNSGFEPYIKKNNSLKIQNLELKNITSVSNWSEFEDAVRNKNVSYIKLKNSISATGSRTANMILPSTSAVRDLTIDGNGYQIDLNNRARISLDGYGSIPANKNVTFALKNTTVNNVPMYGMFAAYGINTNKTNPNFGSGKIIYDNVNYNGAQIQWAPQFETEIYNNTTFNLSGNPSYGYLQTSNLIVDKDAIVTINSQSTLTSAQSLIDLGSLSNSSVTINGHLLINQSGRTSGTNVVNMTGSNANFTVNESGVFSTNLNNDSSTPDSVINMSGQGSSLTVKSDGYFNIDTTNIKKNSAVSSSSIILMGNNSSIQLEQNSNFNVQAYVNSISSWRITSNNGITLGNNSTFNIKDYVNFKLNVNYDNPSYGDSTRYTNALAFGSNNSFIISPNANVSITSNVDNTVNSTLLSFGSNGQLTLNNSKNVSFKLTTPNSKSTLINFGFSSNLEFTNQDVMANYGNNNKDPRGVTSIKFTSPEWGDLVWKHLNKVSFPNVNQAVSSSDTYAALTMSSSSNQFMSVDSVSESTKTSFVSNFNPAFYQELNFSQSNNGNQSDLENSRDVYNSDDLISAMMNASVDRINIKASFAMDSFKTIGGGRMFIPNKTLTIYGGKNMIDLRNANFYNDNNIPDNMSRHIQVNDLNMYGQSYFGLFDSWGRNYGVGKGDLTYNNVTYKGSQLTSSLYQSVRFSGEVKVDSVSSYTSPIDNQTYYSEGSGQENIEAGLIEFLEGVSYTGTAVNSDVIYLVDDSSVPGIMSLGKNAKVNLYSVPKTGKLVNGTGYTDALLHVAGSVNLGKNSELNLYSKTDAINPVMNFVGSKPSSVNVSNSAKLNIHLNDPKGSTSTGDVISMPSASSTIQVGSYGEINISGNYNRYYSSNVIDAPNAKIRIGSKGIFTMNLTGNTNPTAASTKSNTTMLNTGDFVANDAHKIDFNVQEMDNPSKVNLISSSSNGFKVENTKISAWNTLNSSNMPDYLWESVYKLYPIYSRNNVRSVNVSGGPKLDVNSLTSQYRSQNFSRILFEGYPDLSITLDGLTSDKNDVRSKRLSGTTNRPAYVDFSSSNKQSILPRGINIQPDILDTMRYVIQTDNSNKYLQTLSQTNKLASGDTITATGFDIESGKKVQVQRYVQPIINAKLMLVAAPNLNFENSNKDYINQDIQTQDDQNFRYYSENVSKVNISVSFSEFKNSYQESLPVSYILNGSSYSTGESIPYYNQSVIQDGNSNISISPEDGLKIRVLKIPNSREYESVATWTITSSPQ